MSRRLRVGPGLLHCCAPCVEQGQVRVCLVQEYLNIFRQSFIPKREGWYSRESLGGSALLSGLPTVCLLSAQALTQLWGCV